MENQEQKINGDVALAVPNQEDKYLILKRSEQNSSSGEWVFPGGSIEENENSREAALRELKEETGLKGEIRREGSNYIGEGELGLWKIHPYYVKVEDRDVELNHEHSDYKWLTLEQLKQHDTMGQLKSLKALNII